MTYAEFLNSFNPVIEAFDSRKFPTVVLERIHFRVRDLTKDEIQTMCELIIDNCEHAPKTLKVVEFANMARARHRVGTYQEKPEIESRCTFCHDLGVVRAIATNNSGETLMLCECADEKDPSNWKLPKWTRQWAPLFSKEPCYLEWFKPLRIETDKKTGEFKLESLDSKRNAWREKVRRAEKFWVDQRKKHTEKEGA